MSADRLTAAELAVALESLAEWTLSAAGDAIRRDLVFADFSQAMAFMLRVAMKAEQMDHHPEWSNVYNRVSVRLTTHDLAGVSNRDLTLAMFIDGVAPGATAGRP